MSGDLIWKILVLNQICISEAVTDRPWLARHAKSKTHWRIGHKSGTYELHIFYFYYYKINGVLYSAISRGKYHFLILLDNDKPVRFPIANIYIYWKHSCNDSGLCIKLILPTGRIKIMPYYRSLSCKKY